MDKIRDEKKKIRQEVLGKRKRLSKGEIQDRSEKICKQLVNLKEFKRCKTILIYVAMADEVQTEYLFRVGFDQKKLLVVPIVQKAGELLLLSALSELHIKELLSEVPGNTYWNRSKFGILEPRQDTLKPVSASEIELVVVPGLGFDREGKRVGFGGGHYDRLLAKSNKSTLAIAVAFDFQIYNRIPHCDHDHCVDMVITDHEVIRPKKNKNECKQTC
ncbi:MAG: 5-formyltetrahydrofolate cyclo-ligase [Candidatus Anammoxibacter sp.]